MIFKNWYDLKSLPSSISDMIGHQITIIDNKGIASEIVVSQIEIGTVIFDNSKFNVYTGLISIDGESIDFISLKEIHFKGHIYISNAAQ
jgi:hypothetical protein